MKNCAAENVRNFVLAGHAGAGKTSLADLMLFKGGDAPRLGSVDEGTSVSDFRDEEKQKKSSIFSAAMHCPWKDGHFFFVDTPGYPDFCGDAIAAMGVTDMVIIVVDAVAGIGPGSRQAWRVARDRGVPRAFFINGCDRDQADYDGVLAQIQQNYGATVCLPYTIPLGAKTDFSGVACILDSEEGDAADLREALMDTVAESDDDLMEKYLDEGELTPEEITKGLHAAVANGGYVPVFAGSAAKDIGIEELMDGITAVCPSPLAGAPVALVEGELDRTSADAVAYVFKSINDPFIGQLTLLRVYSGTFDADSELQNVTQGDKERVGALLQVNGKDQDTVDSAGPGEIVAIAKLKNTKVGDVLAKKRGTIQFAPLQFPVPTMSYAIFSVGKGDEDKIGSGLHRFCTEDATFTVDRNAETHQTVINGMGDQHINIMIGRLKDEFKVEVRLETPKIPYRETIMGTGAAVYRHKKQTGGHGQFAEVHLRLEPLPDQDFEFAKEVVGGNIPKNFIPAVEKGVVETMVSGPLANCKVINVRAVVFDGKHHPVDSSEMAFKIAARGAFRDAMTQAKPCLLEPIMKLKITFPEEYVGDISGDLNSRRGRILGMNMEEGMQVVNADVPMAETFSYSTQLRSLTHGRGSFEMQFDRYEMVPSQLSKEIMAEAAKEHEEED
ncbi:MAG: elongation factor G [Lentisphaeria bacterium]|nr:elongation factor G [Lentisphaeria bacterium]